MKTRARKRKKQSLCPMLHDNLWHIVQEYAGVEFQGRLQRKVVLRPEFRNAHQLHVWHEDCCILDDYNFWLWTPQQILKNPFPRGHFVAIWCEHLMLYDGQDGWVTL